MSEETKFPEWRKYENDDGSGWTVMISRLEMDDWFRRCMADYPLSYYQPDPDDWFEKWFSQFKENDE